MVNATLLGAAWGILRMMSGSVVVASISHGLWNGLAYVLFGFGVASIVIAQWHWPLSGMIYMPMAITLGIMGWRGGVGLNRLCK